MSLTLSSPLNTNMTSTIIPMTFTSSMLDVKANLGLWSTIPATHHYHHHDHPWHNHHHDHHHDSHDDTHVVFPATGHHGFRFQNGKMAPPPHSGRRQKVSKEFAEKVSYVFVIVLIPIFSVLGSVGNILSLIVLVHQRMRSATNTLLAALAVSDLLVLLHAAYFSFLRIYKLQNVEEGNRLRTLTFPILGPYSSVFTARITTCLTTILSLERLVAVYCPMTAKTRCSRTRTAIHIALIYLLTPLAFLPTAFKYHSTYTTKHIPAPSHSKIHSGNGSSSPATHSISVPVMALTSFGQDKTFFAIYGNILNVVFRLIPIMMLMVVNALIAVAIKKVFSRRKSLSHHVSNMSTTTPIPSHTSSLEQTRITLMLVTVSTVFLVCILPGAVHSLYTQIDSQYTRFGGESNLYNVLATATYFLEVVNSSVNFLIYFTFSRKFSRTYREIFCCRRVEDNNRSVYKFSLRGGSKSKTKSHSHESHSHHKGRYSFKHKHSNGAANGPAGGCSAGNCGCGKSTKNQLIHNKYSHKELQKVSKPEDNNYAPEKTKTTRIEMNNLHGNGSYDRGTSV